jgi:hypothetical protein
MKLFDLGNTLIEGNDFELVARIKEMVPEYKSNNSVFSRLDIRS